MPKARRSVSHRASRKVGLLGGTFDPPHIAHLILAQTALDELQLDEIWFIPAFRPPHKRGERVSPFAHRLQMLRLAVRGNKRFKVLTIEKEKGGLSYTVETLPLLRQKHPHTHFFLLLGSDNLSELGSWREPEKVFSMAQPVFAHRPLTDEKLPAWLEHAVWLSNLRLEISATDLRAHVRTGRSIRYLVPEAVERYIQKKGLYRRK